MLNAFIRQSHHVSMANYIFPVNGHGLVRTVGNTDAFRTPLYYVFQLYREHMTGKRIDVKADGPGVNAATLDFSIQGDASEMDLGNQILPYIDAAAVVTTDGTLNVAFSNRSPDTMQKVRLALPDGYVPIRKWEISHPDINAFNSPEARFAIIPREEALTRKQTQFEVPPCGWMLIQLKMN